MSDNWLQFVPADPTYRPSRAAADQAKTLLASFVPRAHEANVEFKDAIEFIHAGSNWSRVNCPVCGTDAEAWWSEAVGAAFNNFTDLNVTAPCCGARVSLNEMKYVWPVGFASFVIEAMNPGVADLSPEQEELLASCLGCKLRKIWVHI